MNKTKKKLTSSWFRGKTVTVFGIGSLGGGVSVIKYLTTHGAKVIATDIKKRNELATSLKELRDVKNVSYILGQHRSEDFTRVDMVIKTPSCPWTNKHIKLAQSHHIPIETDASLFFQLCKNQIIGITGTKGKTTTAHMISHLLKKTGQHPIQVGVGITPVLDRLDLLKKNSVVVFELSSWRLSGLQHVKISPHIAVFTNFFPDHMNYYKNLEQYLQDKKHIFLYQKKTDDLIYNHDDTEVVTATTNAPGYRIPVSVSGAHILDAQYFVDDNIAYKREGSVAHKLFALDDIHVRGQHNKRNMLMACATVEAYGVKRSKIITAAKSFQTIKHRLEHVAIIDGVDYYNDTAATNPRAAIAALKSFSRPVILLAGGAEKNLPVEEFARTIHQRTKEVLFFKGLASEKIIKELKKLAPDKKKISDPLYDSMKGILEKAQSYADKGDVVLLSPGAASFGLFKNEFDRGNQFCEYVLAMQK